MEFVVLDFETTGLSGVYDRIIEIGYAHVKEGQILEVHGELVNPGVAITNPKITEITGITNDMLVGKRPLEEAMKDLHTFIEGKLIVAHNAGFDMGFLNATCYRMGLPTYHSSLCTAEMFRAYKKEHKLDFKGASLAKMVDYFGLTNEAAHRASADAEVTAQSLLKMMETYDFRNHLNGPAKRAKVANDPNKPTKKDKYMHLFDAHTSMEDICEIMKVKEGTAGKYFLEWMAYADPSPYEAFIRRILPQKTDAHRILQMRQSGKGTAEIFREFGGQIEYYAIQLVGRLYSRKSIDKYYQ